jgi:hypothetical protein
VNHFGDPLGEIIADSLECIEILAMRQHIADFRSDGVRLAIYRRRLFAR